MSETQRRSLLDYLALFIAFCALGYTIYQGYLDRDYLRRSNQPYMMASFFFTEEGSGFFFGNSGLGQARLVWFQILVDGNPQQDWLMMLRSLGFPEKLTLGLIRPGARWRPDSRARIFWLDPGRADQMLRERRSRIELRACYCSIFDECWLGGDRGEPSPVGSCTPKPEIRYGGETAAFYEDGPVNPSSS